MKNIAGILLIILASSCATRQALPSEVVLFPKPGENKIWLINTIAEDYHFCSLISFETASTREYLTSFACLWSKKDSAYYYGIRSTNKATVAQLTEFPVYLDLLKSDSSSNECKLVVSRRKTVWKGELGGKASKVKVKYKTRSDFHLFQVSDQPQVWTTAPLNSILSPVGKVKTETTSILCMSVFKTDKDLIALAANGTLVWMDLVLDDGTQFNGLFKVNEKTTSLIGYSIKDPSLQYTTDKRLAIEAKYHWKSTASGKSYPLTYTIQFPNTNKTIHIRPLLENQEINAKKSSFWMGAIEAIDPEKKVKTGSGNMYIFNK